MTQSVFLYHQQVEWNCQPATVLILKLFVQWLSIESHLPDILIVLLELWQVGFAFSHESEYPVSTCF